MAERRDELRDELMALLAASRELGPSSDAELATIFLDRKESRSLQRHEASHWRVSKAAASVAFIGAVWVSAAAILTAIPYYYYMHDSDVAVSYWQTVPIVLVVAVLLTVITVVSNLTHWRLPRIRVELPPAPAKQS